MSVKVLVADDSGTMRKIILRSLNMITTEAEKRRVVEAIQAGATDYLVKPFTPETLREKLDKHVAAMK